MKAIKVFQVIMSSGERPDVCWSHIRQRRNVLQPRSLGIFHIRWPDQDWMILLNCAAISGGFRASIILIVPGSEESLVEC